MKKLIELNIEYKPFIKSSSQYYFGNDDGEFVTLGKVDKEKFKEELAGYGKDFIKEEIKAFKAHADFVEYDIEAYIDGQNGLIYYDNVKIGKKNKISKTELYKLFKNKCIKNIDDNGKIIDKESFDKLKFTFHAIYPKVIKINDSHEQIISKAKNLIENKKQLEFLIKNLNNKNLSDVEYLNNLQKVYSINIEKLFKLILKKHFKNPIKVTINTSIPGSPVLEILGCGSDFSYIMHDTKKRFNVYVEDGTIIDTNKIYTEEELSQLIKDTNALVSEPWSDEFKNVNQTEIASLVRHNITKASLLYYYTEYLKYYKIAKLDIAFELNNKKSDKSIRKPINNADNTINELEKNSQKEL